MHYFDNFYPTYEALKLFYIGHRLISIKHFYPTYEALKLIDLIVWFIICVYFYPTYEALKLRYGSIRVGGRLIFTLPMRH